MIKNKSSKPKRYLTTVLVYIITVIVCFIFFFPCLWIILAAFSGTGSIYNFNGFFPPNFSLKTFEQLFTGVTDISGDTVMYPYVTWFLNTLIIAVATSIIGTLLLISTAYVISRFEFKARRKLMKGALVLGMFPSFMGMTAVFIMCTQFSLLNNLWGPILMYSATAPVGYLVQKGFFDSIPTSIYEAARIDGVSNFKAFYKITLPLSKPILVYTVLTQFTWPWSDFILPKLLLQGKEYYTVAVGLMTLPDTEFSRFCAGSVFIAVPIVLLYFFVSKYMVNGLTAGAVKG